MSYSVIDPQIEEVLDLDTGEYLRADMLIGSDYGSVMRLRMALRTDIAGEKPRYGCELCSVPVYLVRMAQAERFFFRHLLEDGRCVAHTRGQLSEKEILARKYDGAKESRLHLQMKEWIARSLAADPSFSDIQTESTWTSIGTGRRRRPDVRARHGDLPVAFEVQLSTTFIRVIAERRQFYLSEGGLLFWVFGRFGEQIAGLPKTTCFITTTATHLSSMRRRQKPPLSPVIFTRFSGHIAGHRPSIQTRPENDSPDSNAGVLCCRSDQCSWPLERSVVRRCQRFGAARVRF